jgi:hypothetical protein
MNDPPDPTSRVHYVALVAGNEMHVQVGDSLPSRFAVIDSDVVGGRKELLIQNFLLSFEQLKHGGSLSMVKLEERGNVAVRNYEAVARVSIANRECQII